MDFFETVRRRRSIRKFSPEAVSEGVIRSALEAAVLAPNSSNMQTWDFYWVRTAGTKAALVTACFGQAAARTAGELVAVVADPALWRRSNPEMIRFVQSVNAPGAVKAYYEKLIPAQYRWGIFNSLVPLKRFFSFVIGLTRPMPRGPHSRRDLQEVAIKSAALAAENFVLACTAQGYATCMMEGFDEVRVKRLLKLGSSARVVMVIAVGKEGERGTWGPQFRIPISQVVHEV